MKTDFRTSINFVSTIFCRALLLALLSASPLAAADRCGVPEQLNDLIDTVSRQSAHEGVLSTRALRKLRIDLGRAERVIAAREDDLGLGAWKPAFDWMIVATREAAHSGRFTEPDRLRTRVGALIVGMRFSCNSAAGGGKGSSLTGQADGSLKSHIEGVLGRRISDLSVLEQSLAALLAVLFLVSFTVGLIWIGNAATKWVAAHFVTKSPPTRPPPSPPAPKGIYNSHECRIHGALEIGPDVIEGDVVSLDEIGARFQPVNTGAFERILAVAANTQATLVVGPHQISFQILDVHQGVVTGFFTDLMEPELMSGLLAASEIEPQFTPLPSTAKNDAKLSD